MIKRLAVENLAIVDRLDVHFQPGLSVITGETGVGKSIIVNAVSLALGGRGRLQWLKPGAQCLSVTLGFDASRNLPVREWLAERRLERETGDCVVHRTVDKNGRSRACVNSRPVTISQLKSLGAWLIDISGQNRHQSLVRRERQQSILDARCRHADALAAMREACKRYGTARRRLKELEDEEQETSAQKEWLRYQYEEIKSLAPQPGEYEAIDAEHQLLSRKEDLMQDLQDAHGRLWENPEDKDLYSELEGVKRQIAKHGPLSASIESAAAQLEEAAILIKQAADELRRCLTSADLSEERLQELNERLAAYNELARKHKLAPEALAEKQMELQKRLDGGGAAQRKIREQRRLMHQAEEEYQKRAEEVSRNRQANALPFSEEVTGLLNELGMPDSQLKVAFRDRREQGPRSEGREDVEFLVRTNRGHAYGKIAELASGGELSRLSLAVQLLTRGKRTASALLFDEVDAGIGGQAAKRMGQLLKKLSLGSQLICITHSASIAAQGNQHYAVRKKQVKNGTQVAISLLPEKERRYEIARMMAGANVTRQSLDHAQSMLQAAAEAEPVKAGAAPTPASFSRCGC